MKQWRSRDWEEIAEELRMESHYGTSGAELGAFGYGVEAGADAMLEALIAKLERMNVSLDINDHLAIGNDTWLVIKGLIPDEETDE